MEICGSGCGGGIRDRYVSSNLVNYAALYLLFGKLQS